MQKVTHHGCVRDNVVYFVHVVLPPCPMAAATATVASIHDARQCVRYRNPKILDEKINKKWAKTNKQMTLPHGPGGRNFANKRLWVSCVNADPLCRTAFSHISYCFCCAKFSWWFHVWDFWGNSNHYFSHYLSTNDECWKAPWHGTTVPCVTCTHLCVCTACALEIWFGCQGALLHSASNRLNFISFTYSAKRFAFKPSAVHRL